MKGSPTTRCPTCGKNRNKSTPNPVKRIGTYARLKSGRRVLIGPCARRPSAGWKCETCKKTRYGERKYAKRSNKDITIARAAILDKLEYEEERATGLEAKVLSAIGDFLRDLWDDPASWEYEDEKGE